MLPKRILSKASVEFGLSERTVDQLYSLWWKEVRNHITSLDVDNINGATDINIPHLGKLILSTQELKHRKNADSKKDKTSE